MKRIKNILALSLIFCTIYYTGYSVLTWNINIATWDTDYRQSFGGFVMTTNIIITVLCIVADSRDLPFHKD